MFLLYFFFSFDGILVVFGRGFELVNIHKTQKGSVKVGVMLVFSFAFFSLLFSHLYPSGVLLSKAVFVTLYQSKTLSQNA